MDFVRKLIKPLTPIITLAFLGLSLTIPTVQAEMVSTQTMIEKENVKQKRQEILKLYDRKDVQKIMKAKGITAPEAQSRINSMTDREVLTLASRIDNLPAGAGGDVLLLLILLIIILEATGVTNIFTFI